MCEASFNAQHFATTWSHAACRNERPRPGKVALRGCAGPFTRSKPLKVEAGAGGAALALAPPEAETFIKEFLEADGLFSGADFGNLNPDSAAVCVVAAEPSSKCSL